MSTSATLTRPETDESPIATWRAGVAGLAAGALGLAVATVLAYFVAPSAAPLPAIGALIISVLPDALINFGKDFLGFADKPVLLGLVTAGALALTVLAGIWEARRPGRAITVYLPLTLLAIVAAYLQPASTWVSFVPAVLAMIAALFVLRVLLSSGTAASQVADTSAPTAEAASRSTRRNFLIASGVVLGAAALAGVRAQAAIEKGVRSAAARVGITLPAPANPAPAIPAGADFSIQGLAPYVSPNDNFYRIDTALQVPSVNPDTWELKITGMVDEPFSITFAEVLELPLTEHVATLTCVSNPVGGDLVGNARWLGYPLHELLARAKPQRGADMVLSTSADGWTAGTPLEILQEKDRMCLLAVGMNGEPLPAQHGFPARLVVPGLYGYVSATKWVTELKLTTFEQDQGYWTPRGWSALGPIKLGSRIDTPNVSRTVNLGETPNPVIAGVAWAQHTGISKVEVQIDEGSWQEAQLAAVTGPDTWRQWRLDWSPQPGDYVVRVRATDAGGTLQSEEVAAVAPNGATGYDSRRIRVEG